MSRILADIKKNPLIIVFIVVLAFNAGCKEKIREDNTWIISRLDVSPDENQVDYSPEDGSTVKTNPPPFTWLPVKKNIEHPADYVKYSGNEFQEKIWNPVKEDYSYTLQISKDKNFKSGVITKKGIEISTYALDETLEPGEWYWRYGIENGKTIFGKSRRFIVPKDVKNWPFPKDMNQVINSIPKGHPRLFILENEVDSYRNRALNGDLKETLSELKNNLEKHIGEELPGEPKFTKGIGPEFGEHSWRLIYDVVIPPCDIMETFGLAYLLSGDKKYGEEARRRLLHFVNWNPDGSTSDRVHNESNYRIVDQGSRAYDWTYELFTPDERELIKKTIKRRTEQLYQRLKYRPGSEYHVYNRGSHEERITGFLAQAAICFADEWQEAAEWLKYSLIIHWNLYPAWAKEDGGWHQGPAYWTGYQSRVLHFITALKKSTGIDLMQKDFFQNTPYYILYSNPPYARFSPFGDGEHGSPNKGRGEVLYLYSSILNDPYLRWYADFLGAGHPNNVLGILLKNDNIESKAPENLPQSRYFPGIGLVSLHTSLGNAEEDIHFLFHSDPYGGVSHGHPDQNAFTIEAFGEALTIATGYYPWYGSDHHILWQRQTKSSNSITINGGTGQEGVAAAKGEIARFESNDVYDYILGDATKAYMGLLNKFQRHVVHLRPGVFIIYDDIEAPEPVTFEWWLHALSEMKMDKSAKSILISEGNANLRVLFLQSGDLSFNQFTGFPYPPEVRGENSPEYKDNWHFTASTASKEVKTRFITVLVPYKKNKEPKFSVNNVKENDDEVSIELSIENKTFHVSFHPEILVKQASSN
jgi:hypothetical protein